MKSLLRSLLLGLGLTLALASAVHAKDAAIAASATSAKAPALLDINSASKEELSGLPKIGDVRSAAIIKGRPYRGKDELVSKKIISADVYGGIKDLIIAKQAPKTATKKK